ncbi:protein-tyrosine-phosphatase [Coemansia spiralis]|uniref:Protein-tyrosine-phosphatase n=2 Tax=Coemansia TaxID=4863 RepID=A0A9W8L0D7_9FUNG|nr:protein-tyrosine-phosphatase [Coemansia umbellata]KAJ2625474.1 protein-tyrosine-phosphatase [Coemansia sp. RSA 1358]KAJ2680599.1 protein-tyrosine-phosphatase [Coemansia spiralis]
MASIIDPLIPPYRFERIQPSLYRGGYPKPRNYRFLRRQRLKTIVSLIPGDQDNSLTSFCSVEGIERITLTVQSPDENVTLSEEMVSRCLELVTDPTRAPLYIHCLDGSNVTGVVVMCLRKLQLWRVASYQNEYLRFEQDGEIIPEESEFVETYSGNGLVLKNPYVSWLWPGRQAKYSDANMLPFQDGAHPVVPFVKLMPKASTEICLPDPNLVISRSATDPNMLTSSSDVAESVFGPSMQGGNTDTSQQVPSSTLSTKSDNNASTATAEAEADATTAVSDSAAMAGGSFVQNRLFRAKHGSIDVVLDTENSNLHTSLSTSALPTDVSSARDVQTGHSHTGDSDQRQLPHNDSEVSVHKLLDPILAALVAEQPISTAIDDSSKGSGSVHAKQGDNGPSSGLSKGESRGSNSTVQLEISHSYSATQKDNIAPYASNMSGVLALASQPESINNGTLSTSSIDAAAILPCSTGPAVGVLSADAGIDETQEASALVKEITLSQLVQALAIEGLGM